MQNVDDVGVGDVGRGEEPVFNAGDGERGRGDEAAPSFGDGGRGLGGRGDEAAPSFGDGGRGLGGRGDVVAAAKLTALTLDGDAWHAATFAFNSHVFVRPRNTLPSGHKTRVATPSLHCIVGGKVVVPQRQKTTKDVVTKNADS